MVFQCAAVVLMIFWFDTLLAGFASFCCLQRGGETSFPLPPFGVWPSCLAAIHPLGLAAEAAACAAVDATGADLGECSAWLLGGLHFCVIYLMTPGLLVGRGSLMRVVSYCKLLDPNILRRLV